MGEERRAEKLMPWFGMECRCERCLVEKDLEENGAFKKHVEK